MECEECRVEGTKDGHEVVCPECGMVLVDTEIDPGPEWRSFDNEEKKRVGSPNDIRQHDNGIGSEMGWEPDLSEEERRLRMRDYRAATDRPGERTIRGTLSEVRRISSKIGAPESVEKTSSKIVKELVNQYGIMGRSMEGIAAASVYIGCQIHSVPRPPRAIAEYAQKVDSGKILRDRKYISKELSLGIDPIDPREYIDQFCSDLGFQCGSEVRRESRRLLNRYIESDENHTGKSPSGLASGAIYLATRLCGERVTQYELSDVVGRNPTTIRNRYQEIAEVSNR